MRCRLTPALCSCHACRLYTFIRTACLGSFIKQVNPWPLHDFEHERPTLQAACALATLQERAGKWPL